MKLNYIAMTVDGADNSKLISVARELNASIIDFTTSNMENLTFIAKHRLLPSPTLLILDRTKVVGRFVGEDIPDVEAVKAMSEVLSIVS